MTASKTVFPLPGGHPGGLYTDMYEMTMAQGYFYLDKEEETASFDYFFRKNPFQGGYTLFAGLGSLLEELVSFRFSDDDIAYLDRQGFRKEFLDYLKNFRFKGTVWSVPEGDVVFPNEPLLRIEGTLIETQLVESLVLNYLNFQSLIATKAARIRRVAGDRLFADFGLRRAQGLGSLHASRAAVIGGAGATSNVLAGKQFGLAITGTQAHSWIQSFDDELTAFRKFTELYPDQAVILVDTYDTLQSGVPNAIKIAGELEKAGHKLGGIRLDSGDLAYLSKKARKMLDDAGLDYVKIIASNQLDEYVIRSLNIQQAPIDGFGIGTRMITGMPDAALDGVYKLTSANGIPRLKISDNIEKVTLPGMKKIIRLLDADGNFAGDGIILEDEDPPDRIVHPFEPRKFTETGKYKTEELQVQVMEKGEIMIPLSTPSEIAEYARTRLALLPEEHHRFEYPHVYKVGISPKLMQLRNDLVNGHKPTLNFQNNVEEDQK